MLREGAGAAGAGEAADVRDAAGVRDADGVVDADGVAEVAAVAGSDRALSPDAAPRGAAERWAASRADFD